MLFQLSHRRRDPEMMDDPALDEGRHLQALRGLSRLNRFGNSAGLIWPSLARLAHELQRPVRVLDLATGSGDVPLALSRMAQQRRLPMEFSGCDLSARAVALAQRHSLGTGQATTFFVHDVLTGPLPSGYDAILCSLFLHHLERPAAIDLLVRMSAACGSLLLISDLIRTPSTMLMTYLASRIVTRSDVVHTDGPLSVRAAFDLQEARLLAQDAGLNGGQVRRAWPCRFLLTWRRNSND